MSIASAQKNENPGPKTEVPKILFLNIDGFLVSDQFELSGMQYVSINNESKFAGKVEQYDKTFVYYVKTFRGGRPGEVLYDPYGALSKPTDLSLSTARRGERFCEYMKVSEVVFNSYLQYLRTRNPIWFKQAERTILNNEATL